MIRRSSARRSTAAPLAWATVLTLLTGASAACGGAVEPEPGPSGGASSSSSSGGASSSSSGGASSGASGAPS
ncbi:MAG TPA: hypothetical protein VLT33_45985, partial [Labilithrix sp.]|nr:hypothetical protein [Labilithrix sp.]